MPALRPSTNTACRRDDSACVARVAHLNLFMALPMAHFDRCMSTTALGRSTEPWNKTFSSRSPRCNFVADMTLLYATMATMERNIAQILFDAFTAYVVDMDNDGAFRKLSRK